MLIADTPPPALRTGADRLIAEVLECAHRAALAYGAPHEARVILHVAHAFADRLDVTTPHFDRLRFIEAVTGDRPRARGAGPCAT
jgi:hypothetical protein